MPKCLKLRIKRTQQTGKFEFLKTCYISENLILTISQKVKKRTVEQDNRNQNDSVFSRKIRAGRRRTYFFDVRTTKSNDYYLTITESKKRNDNNGYERHKIFVYKEDFNKFLSELTDVVDYIKSQMPDFDFDSFNHVYEQDGHVSQNMDSETKTFEANTKTEDNSAMDNTGSDSKEDSNTLNENEKKATGQDEHEDLKW